MVRSAPWTAKTFEQLEERRLLSGVFDVSKVPVYVPTSGDINDVKNGPLGNIGSRLASLYADYKKFVRKGGAAADYMAGDKLLQTDGTRVAVTVRTRGGMNTLAGRIRDFGGELILRNGTYKTIDAWIPVSQLSTLARDSAVLNATPAYKANLNFRGEADNQADIAQNADAARTTFGVDGTGIKVGVLSDSVDQFENGLADSVASGDLPKGVTVIDDALGGTDEGRAMLELIHDIAPGAQLYFATADPTAATFAHNIIELARAGCTVIVDDIGYSNEPLFQEGIISQAITYVTEEFGVSYFSSVANSGAAGFQIDANWVEDINGRLLLDFDPGEGVDTRLRVTSDSAAAIIFQWDNPYNGIVGAASTDLDINLIEPTSGQIFSQGADSNVALGTPIEVVSGGIGLLDIEISIPDRVPGTSLPTLLRLRSFSPAGLSDPEYNLKRTSSGGHNSGQETISVGAVPFNLAPPYNTTQTITNEDFSSLGEATYLFKSNGERREKAVTLQKPDISAIDGVNTSFFGTDSATDKDKLPNFFGTSAAAPNAAAVAALMLELNVDATPAMIRSALIESAKDNPLNGQKPGKFDPQGGFGLIDGLQALHIISPGTVVADIGRIVPDSVPRGIDQVTIKFSSPVTGFNISDLNLLQSKDLTVDLLEGSNAKVTTDDGQTYVLKGLSALTNKRGTYFLQLRPNGVTDADGHPALQGEISFFNSGKPTGFAAIPVTSSEINLTWTDNNNKETGYRIYRALNADFTKGLESFRVKPNVTTYKDTGLTQTTQYFYKVKAIDDDGAPSPTSDVVSAFTLAPNETVVDNRSADNVVIKGSWNFIEDEPAAFGRDYLAASASKERSVSFTPDLASAGTYVIYVRGIKSKSNSSQTPIDVLVDGDVKKTIVINQQDKSGWVQLGTFKLAKGDATTVRIRNTGADGTVIADAIRFQRTSTAASGIKVTAGSNGLGSLFSTESVKRDDLLSASIE